MSDSDFRLMAEGPHSLVIRRSFEAEGEEIIKAMLDPELLPKWMGAPEMPVTTCEVDARPGGRYRIAWTQPNGAKSWMAGRLIDIGPDRIVATEIHRPDWTGGEMRVTTQVKDHEDRGWLRRIVEFSSPAARNQAMGTMAPGTKAGFDRLEKLLTEDEE
ncbi:MAG: SRPBCC domain-containing protein [Gemmobacter sp.]